MNVPKYEYIMPAATLQLGRGRGRGRGGRGDSRVITVREDTIAAAIRSAAELFP